MNATSFVISNEQPEHEQAVETLSEIAFGPGRFARTAFRLREGKKSCPRLSFVCHLDGQLIGSVKLTRIKIGDDDSLLLGPLVVIPEFKNYGYGKKLMEAAVEAARREKQHSILLVGDEPYYGRFGFEKVPAGSVTMPGPVDPHRLLVCYLQPDSKPVSGAAT